MAILEYIPPTNKVIIDNRKENENYYKAICDSCGTEFYPKRRNAKYCNTKCKVIQNRINLINNKI